MRVFLLYLVLSGGLWGLFYAVPEFRQFGVRHRRRFVGAFGVGLLLVCFIYFLEIVNV